MWTNVLTLLLRVPSPPLHYLRPLASSSPHSMSPQGTQPRRISAISVAERVAEERLERVGDVIGYAVRLQRSSSAHTRLTFCTTGILLRRLVGDPTVRTKHSV